MRTRAGTISEKVEALWSESGVAGVVLRPKILTGKAARLVEGPMVREFYSSRCDSALMTCLTCSEVSNSPHMINKVALASLLLEPIGSPRFLWMNRRHVVNRQGGYFLFRMGAPGRSLVHRVRYIRYDIGWR